LFTEVEITEALKVRRYPNLSDLLRNISRTGTGGWHPGRQLLNRRQIKDLEKWFLEECGGCQASYQIFMVKSRK
jgi:hypothetical protein